MYFFAQVMVATTTRTRTDPRECLHALCQFGSVKLTFYNRYESNGFGGGIYTSPTGQQNNACTKVASKSDTTCTPPSKKSGTTCTTVRSESHQTSVYPDGETHHAHTKYSVLVRSKQS